MEGALAVFHTLHTILTAHATQAFWDATGALWAKGALAGKYAGVFVSTATLGGGQGKLGRT